MRVLELKVPPPAVALVIAVLMWLVSRAAPALAFVFPAGNLLSQLAHRPGFRPVCLSNGVAGRSCYW